MQVLLRDVYNYEFEGFHEVTPQDEEEPEENTFDFKFLLFMTVKVCNDQLKTLFNLTMKT